MGVLFIRRFIEEKIGGGRGCLSFYKLEMGGVFRTKQGSSWKNTGSFDLSPCLEQGERVVFNESALCTLVKQHFQHV